MSAKILKVHETIPKFFPQYSIFSVLASFKFGKIYFKKTVQRGISLTPMFMQYTYFIPSLWKGMSVSRRTSSTPDRSASGMMRNDTLPLICSAKHWRTSLGKEPNTTSSISFRRRTGEGEISGLTHWGRVTHICVSKLTTIGSDNGLSPDRRQAIIWTNAGTL